jgi:apolipoprotein N-acyltransferase
MFWGLFSPQGLFRRQQAAIPGIFRPMSEPFPIPSAAPNLRDRVGGGIFWLQTAMAALSGALLALAFPPAEISLLAWVALVPLLALPVPAALGRRIWTGWLFGAVHFIISLWWLNTIGFCAGVLLALVCAFFAMAWYLLAGALLRRMPGVPGAKGREAVRHPCDLPPFQQCLWMLAAAALWVALEWTRSWFCTGFSWNQLGISQWSHDTLLRLTTFTGVYGISFLIVAVNVAVTVSWVRIARLFAAPGTRLGISWPMPVAMLLFAPLFLLIVTQKNLPMPDLTLRAGAIQGNIPQCRMFTQEELDDSLKTYCDLSRTLADAAKPQLIVWPETAIPARFDDEQYVRERERLFAKTQTPMLIGSVVCRPAVQNPRPDAADDWLTFNSALRLDDEGKLLQSYDKTHPVPFGEYTPFARQLPWLERWIGMGRGLTAGREFTVFRLPGNVRAGVMICYEDAFPGIAREFTRRGAEMLVTITNDAWYAESAGARQHLLHAVFRAAENRRPLLRSGNNSDTCLIHPDGRIEQGMGGAFLVSYGGKTCLVRPNGPIMDVRSGRRFVTGFNIYEIPVWRKLPLTWYAKHGDVFAKSCAGMAAVCIVWLLFTTWRRRRALLEKIAPEA